MSTKTGAYDLIYVPEAWFGEYSQAGYLAPLDADVKNAALTGDGWDFADFNKSALAVYTAADGSLQALPYFAQTPLLVYNKGTSSRKQASASQKTWADLLKAATYFKGQGTGIALPYKQGSAITNVMAVLLAGDDSGFFNASGKLDLNEAGSHRDGRLHAAARAAGDERQRWLALGRSEQGSAVRPGADGHHDLRLVHRARGPQPVERCRETSAICRSPTTRRRPVCCRPGAGRFRPTARTRRRRSSSRPGSTASKD